jgi:F0F1-type ATP synthase membrane subunit b/b'
MTTAESGSESEVDTQEQETHPPVEPMLTVMEERKAKRMEQLAAARKMSLEVRKEKKYPKNKRIELQAQVNKQLYDAKVARVSELESILAISEKRNSELLSQAKLKGVAKSLSKSKQLNLKP